jgi:hypothetical protein
MGNGWANLGTGFTDITMCRNGLMWATDGQSVSFRTGIVDQVNNQGTGWEVVEQMGVTSINCGYRARLWLTTNTGEVQMRTNVNSLNWKGEGWMNVATPTDVTML